MLNSNVPLLSYMVIPFDAEEERHGKIINVQQQKVSKCYICLEDKEEDGSWGSLFDPR